MLKDNVSSFNANQDQEGRREMGIHLMVKLRVQISRKWNIGHMKRQIIKSR